LQCFSDDVDKHFRKGVTYWFKLKLHLLISHW